jgi:phenylacetate-CoA ligase
VGRGDRVLFAFSFGPFLGFWMAFESAERMGCLCLPGGGLSSSARLRMMLDNEVTVLCCTPSYALRLGEVAAAEQLDLGKSKVRVIVVAGEPGGSIPATRQRIEACWAGARVFDHHGMTEVGPVTYECPAQPGRLHVIESGYLAEIVEPATGRPAGPGEPGELILTTLLRPGSPVLRYRTGDLVQRGMPGTGPGAVCVCGRHEMVLEGGILGRVDDMVIVRGVNVHPSAVESILLSVPCVAEYQVRLTRHGSLMEMRVIVEPTADCPAPGPLAGRVAQALETSLALRVPVELVPARTLPRQEMKAKRWIRD